MFNVSAKREAAPLNLAERLIAGMAGVGLLGVALTIVITPPERRVALGQCPNAAAGCVVTVDSDPLNAGMMSGEAARRPTVAGYWRVSGTQAGMLGSWTGKARDVAGRRDQCAGLLGVLHGSPYLI